MPATKKNSSAAMKMGVQSRPIVAHRYATRLRARAVLQRPSTIHVTPEKNPVHLPHVKPCHRQTRTPERVYERPRWSPRESLTRRFLSVTPFAEAIRELAMRQPPMDPARQQEMRELIQPYVECERLARHAANAAQTHH